jgi:multiple sugar transport system substrate-binding protein
MKMFSLKRFISGVLVAATLAVLCVGCGSSDTSTSADTGSTSAVASESKAASSEKSKVVFWYLWSGDAVPRIDALVKAYNEKSDKYEVEALSVADQQKILAAISAGNGPDVTDDFATDIGKYASAGVMEPLDSYIKKTNYDIDDFVPATIESMKMDGITYALPCNMNIYGLYYNKALLKKAGYNEPPKTLEEMYDIAVKTTTLNKDGSIDVCGFPDFPNAYYSDVFTAAAGGGWYTKDCKPSAADDAGNKLALKLNVDYRTKFGVDKVTKFASGGKYLDPTDPFLMGKQTFRVDGPWMGKDIKETFKSDVDYGVTFVPYPKDHPELAGRTNAGCSILFVSAGSKNKDGAFDFLSNFVGKEGQENFTINGGDFPSRLSMLTNEKFKKGYDRDFFSQLAKSKNLVSVPNGPKNGEYMTLLKEQIELCLNLKQDVDTTLKNINQKGNEMMK